MFLLNLSLTAKAQLQLHQRTGIQSKENGGGGGMIPTASIVEENVLCGKSLCSLGIGLL